MNPLLQLQNFGQSIWLDYIRRGMFASGQLKRLIDEDGLRGMTSNPSIFEKAIDGSQDYSEAIRALALEGKSAQEIYQSLSIEDIQTAADTFMPLFQDSGGQHGFVSLEVSPLLARDTQGTIEEARRLWNTVSRPNVMIKVPATLEGIPAIEQLISEGINVNITLLFSIPHYRKVAQAYLAGLETRALNGLPLGSIRSVASFFLSRIDVLVDPLLEKIIQKDGDKETNDQAKMMLGNVAVSSAKIAYMLYNDLFQTERFKKLEESGAQPQRLLWASTSTKNPAYSDVKYVEALIGRDTVNTLPLETLNAYRDYGSPEARLEEDLDEAQYILDHLLDIGIDLDDVTDQLEREGIDKFIQPFKKLMETLEKKRKEALGEPIDRQIFSLGHMQADFEDRLLQLHQAEFLRRFWRKDASLWKHAEDQQDLIRNMMGWLHVTEKMEENLPSIQDFVDEIHVAGFKQVVHMGMGGSSLAPLVFQRSFTSGKNGLPLIVLDTTDPETLLHIEAEIPLKETLFIVASKSGTTAEPLAFADYFYTKLKKLKGSRAGENFVVITDPDTPLVKQAHERGYRRVFVNFPDIGGRYSALSYFGLVPAALTGIDTNELLARALRMLHACSESTNESENPGLVLGAALGELAIHHQRDKVTFLMPRSIQTLGMWLEQLLAESTGKEGSGLLPIAGEPLFSPEEYSTDRLFAYFRLEGAIDAAQEKLVTKLEELGHPVVTFRMNDQLDIGEEFFRWEFATAVAGSILEINPFDQPNVQESKNNTHQLLKAIEEKGQLPDEEPVLVETPLSLYSSEAASSMSDAIQTFLSQADEDYYFAIMAFLPENEPITGALQDLRQFITSATKLPTTLGYGPRFLHSTGQFHKGGKNNGLFLQLTWQHAEEAQVPDKPYTFGQFQDAQARGDLQALLQHDRRVLRIDLGRDVIKGMDALRMAFKQAIAAISGQLNP
jgi:transaldolase/glucose-6-phosphate isomerase